MKVIIYGVGRRYYNLFNWHEYVDLGMITNEIETVGFSDGNSDLWGKRVVHGGSAFVVKNIKEYPEDGYDKIMVTSKECFAEIRDGLVKQGYKGEKIFLADDIFEPYLELINSGYYSLLIKQWLHFCESGQNPVSFFRAGNYKDIAVYGSGRLAEQFIHACRQGGIRVGYLIESDLAEQFGGLPNYRMEDELPRADIIVVAVTEDYMQIESKICRKNDVEVISLQEVIYKTLINV